jgi:hypothetical protein
VKDGGQVVEFRRDLDAHGGRRVHDHTTYFTLA